MKIGNELWFAGKLHYKCDMFEEEKNLVIDCELRAKSEI